MNKDDPRNCPQCGHFKGAYHECENDDQLFRDVVEECSRLRTACETAYMITDMLVRMGDTSVVACRDMLKEALSPSLPHPSPPQPTERA